MQFLDENGDCSQNLMWLLADKVLLSLVAGKLNVNFPGLFLFPHANARIN